MNSGSFHTVFDASATGWRDWWFPAVGLIFVAIALALPLMIRTGAFRRMPPLVERWYPRIALGFAILWTTVTFFVTFRDYRSSVTALRKGTAKFIEGPV